MSTAIAADRRDGLFIVSLSGTEVYDAAPNKNIPELLSLRKLKQ